MPPGGFRLFLATIVVIHHSFPLRLGAWAVGTFFVLSGFWISRMWRVKYSQMESTYWRFVVSRWWRLAPLFIAVQLLAATLVMLGMPVGNEGAVQDWRWWATQPLVVGNSQFNRLLPPSWSLDVEMQFYILAPVLLIGALSFGIAKTVAFGVALLAWSIMRLTYGASLDTPSLDVFAWLFVVGIACERFEIRPSAAMAGLSTMLLAILVGVVVAFPVTRGLVWQRGAEVTAFSSVTATLFFVTMLGCGLPLAMNSVYQRSGAWDRWMGDLSYPLYLFHWLPRDWYYHHVDWSLSPWRNMTLLSMNFLAAFVGAILLLHAIDRPAQRLRDQWLKRQKFEHASVDRGEKAIDV